MLLEIFALFLTTALFGEKDAGFDPPQGPALQAAQLLESINLNSDAVEVQNTLQRTVELLSPQSPAGEKLAEFLANPDDASDLIQVRDEVLQMLTFTPRHEAELPEGFPTFTPPGVIELKVYPKNRRAIAKQFFTLFGHITSNKIAMTTPVRMEFENDKNGKLKQESMAFYYGDPTIGSVGEQGKVQVVEQEGELVVALGHRGFRSQKVIADGERRLLAWIEAHPEYQANGKLIVMGYNSPMVPAKSQFLEIQLPLKKTNSE
ncbi:heme-binding protein [Bythopirellula polymerisocia]|uniref:SOUL heme-binding protein n=1 Tax=Bythopirellula polymerisocia TaxID=2528003 RepID=A0A5C6CHI0_9BACT|nr:heme-binding protein [Bythopirellula polymerisocia]TWU22731.1 SOUL heme-binding protein [Bythopirellula polymerisocia]